MRDSQAVIFSLFPLIWQHDVRSPLMSVFFYATPAMCLCYSVLCSRWPFETTYDYGCCVNYNLWSWCVYLLLIDAVRSNTPRIRTARANLLLVQWCAIRLRGTLPLLLSEASHKHHASCLGGSLDCHWMGWVNPWWFHCRFPGTKLVAGTLLWWPISCVRWIEWCVRVVQGACLFDKVKHIINRARYHTWFCLIA